VKSAKGSKVDLRAISKREIVRQPVYDHVVITRVTEIKGLSVLIASTIETTRLGNPVKRFRIACCQASD